MTENEENEALTALLATARGHYDSRERFHLRSDVVIGFARAVVASLPDVTLDELVRVAGKAGIPRSVLVRVGRGEPAAVPVREKPTEWSRRTRLASNW